MTIRSFLGRIVRSAGLRPSDVSNELLIDYLNESVEAIVAEFDFYVYSEASVDDEHKFTGEFNGMYLSPRRVVVDGVPFEKARAQEVRQLVDNDQTPLSNIWSVIEGDIVILPSKAGSVVQVYGLMGRPKYSLDDMEKEMVTRLDEVEGGNQVLAPDGLPMAAARYRMIQMVCEERGILDKAQYFGVRARRAEEDARKHYEPTDTNTLGFVEGWGA